MWRDERTSGDGGGGARRTGVMMTAASMPLAAPSARFCSLEGGLPVMLANICLAWAKNMNESAFHGTSREMVAV